MSTAKATRGWPFSNQAGESECLAGSDLALSLTSRVILDKLTWLLQAELYLSHKAQSKRAEACARVTMTPGKYSALPVH